MDFGEWILPANQIWCKGSWGSGALQRNRNGCFFPAASLIVSARVRQRLLEGQCFSLGIHTQGLLQLGCLRNLMAMQLCNLHTKWSGLIQNKLLNFKWGGGMEGSIIASFSELIGWESMEGNQEAADKRWQQRLFRAGPHRRKDGHTHTTGLRDWDTPRDTNI